MSKLISKIVVPDSNEATGYSLYNVKDSGAIHSSDVGVAGGVASLDNAGKVPSSQLPSYVDDVVEGYYHENKFYTTYTPGQEEEDPGTYSGEITAETGKIYVDIPTNQSYRWSGSAYIVISSPYVLPTASANTLGGVKVGDNLSIDQNGVLSAQASSPDEVQIGGNTPSSDSDIKIFIDTTEDYTAEIYTKQQQDGKFIVIKDSATAPTESTLTYTENGTVKNFKQGDEVRVPDAEADNGYTFYKLYALTTESGVTTATWDKLGAGGNAGMYETLNISLTQIAGSDSDLIGATVTITNNDTSETIYTGTWNGSALSAQVGVGINYTISCSAITGYSSPSKSDIADSFLKNVTLQYKIIGVFIEATDGTLYTSSQWSGSGKTANAIAIIQESHAVRMSLNEVSKYIHKNNTDPLDNYIARTTNKMSDYDGEGNSDKIFAFNTAYDSNDSSYAVPYCKTFIFPNGKGDGYLPAWAEFNMAYSNAAAVNQCLTAVSGTQLSTTKNHYYYTSSYEGTRGADHRMYDFNNEWGVMDLRPRDAIVYVRVFSKI